MTTHRRILLTVLLAEAIARCAAASPDLRPESQAGYVLRDGSIQVVANTDLQGVLEAGARVFQRLHPDFRFHFVGGNDATAMASLTFGASPFALMDAEFTAIGLVAHRKLVGPDPILIRLAHGSLNPAAQTSPLAVIVNPQNPVATLTVTQVVRIFASGGPKGDVTHWGQLGLGGDWADRPVRTCGLPESDYYDSEDPAFGAFLVLQKLGGLHFNPRFEMYPRYADVVRRVASDPEAMGLVALNRLQPGVKVVALRSSEWSAASSGSADDIASGRYPYDRSICLYLKVEPGKAIEPWVREFVATLLSPAGRAAIQADGKGYIPLNEHEAAIELAKIY